MSAPEEKLIKTLCAIPVFYDARMVADAQLAQRDFLVFEHCKKLGLPVARNLAGGYQTPLRRVLDIHDATLHMCLSTYLEKESLPCPN